EVAEAADPLVQPADPVDDLVRRADDEGPLAQEVDVDRLVGRGRVVLEPVERARVALEYGHEVVGVGARDAAFARLGAGLLARLGDVDVAADPPEPAVGRPAGL